jgi:MATE family multidrug resistance protein
MTEALSRRRVLAIALPIVISNATIPILGAVDTAVVGQMGLAAPIGAVGIGAVILASVYWIFGFLRMGTTGLVAQALGAGDVAETGALLMRGLMIAGVAGLVLIAFQAALFAVAFAAAPASAEVEGLARSYLGIRIGGAPAAIAILALTGWLIAVERTRAVLGLQLWMNGVNVVLNLWFVLGLGWGVQGVAAATLVAEWTAQGLGLWLCRAAFAGDQWRDWGRVFDPARLRRMGEVNGNILIRSVLLQTTTISFMFLAAAEGDVTLAANQVLLQFVAVTAYALDGFAFAAEALVGQAAGGRNRARLRRAAVMASEPAVLLSLALAGAFWLAGPPLIDVMTTSETVRVEARRYLPWMVALPVVSVASYMLDGIFIGATRTREMRNAMLVAAAFYFAALAVLAPSYGNHGLWAALMGLNVARAVTLGMRYPKLEAAVAA